MLEKNNDQEYILMHKNTEVGDLAFDADCMHILGMYLYNPEYAPFLGNCDLRQINKWWEMRAIPGTRTDMERILREAGVETNQEYLAKNLALSITDTYWICPVDLSLTWEKVNLFQAFGSTSHPLPYHNASSYSPNASLGGQMHKYWDMSGSTPVLTKAAYRSHGQQAVNELFATYLHQQLNAGIPFTEYTLQTLDDGTICKCDAFTNPHIELVNAYEIVSSQKIDNQWSNYDGYIDICVDHGIPRDVMQDFMDYQTLTDFIISNTDEHLMNFGILRDADTLDFIAPAPIFDSGNSMFYLEMRDRPYTRVELLEREVTSFYKNEEKLLSKVHNRTILDAAALPSREFVKDFYCSNGIPEEKAAFISSCYAVKVQMLHDFQSGKTISLYHEKEAEKFLNKSFCI